MRLDVRVFDASVGDCFKFHAMTGLCELFSQPRGKKNDKRKRKHVSVEKRVDQLRTRGTDKKTSSSTLTNELTI